MRQLVLCKILANNLVTIHPLICLMTSSRKKTPRVETFCHAGPRSGLPNVHIIL
jgi:hypothetical protein